ncbi:hypothetical protein F4774DRAFT_425706 [Daldinia eschscholtzii]|nr:hypothetical protein F4774DRAFT_425706 [Daldinia eschscholtzii]
MASYIEIPHELGSDATPVNTAYQNMQHGPMNGLPALQLDPIPGPQLQEHGSQLRKHGEKEGHKAYGCICGAKFTRLDALNRHISSKSPTAHRYKCKYCDDPQGAITFYRHDHLIQHFRVYHRISNPNKLRRAKRATIAPSPQAPVLPMPPYPCPVPLCSKMGYDGYLRKVDLDEHVAVMHSPAIMYPMNVQDDVFGQQYLAPPQPDHHDGAFGLM